QRGRATRASQPAAIPRIVNIQDLTPTELSVFRTALDVYRGEDTKYQLKKKAISALRKEVVEFVAKKYGIYIMLTVTLRAMVRAIRTHVKPSDTQARGTAKDNWTKLLKASARGTAVET